MATIRKSSPHGCFCTGSDFTLFFGGSPFCNFHKCSFRATPPDGKEHKFSTSEQYFMYVKALTFGDQEAAAEILKQTSPGIIRGIGRRVRGFEEKRWYDMSTAVMEDAVRAKFSQNADLRFALLVTRGSQLVECSPIDRIWGIGMETNDPEAVIPSKWRGENRLGKALDKIRDELWNDEASKNDRLQIEKNYRKKARYGALYFENLEFNDLNHAYNFGEECLEIH